MFSFQGHIYRRWAHQANAVSLSDPQSLMWYGRNLHQKAQLSLSIDCLACFTVWNWRLSIPHGGLIQLDHDTNSFSDKSLSNETLFHSSYSVDCMSFIFCSRLYQQWAESGFKTSNYLQCLLHSKLYLGYNRAKGHRYIDAFDCIFF